jgi:hypothetical protein
MEEVSAAAPAPELKAPFHEMPESQAPHQMTVKEYCLTRFSTLKPPMNKAPNPFRLLMLLNTKQWMFFLIAFLAWVCLYYLFYLYSVSGYIHTPLEKTRKDQALTFVIRRPGMPLTSLLCL